MTKTTSKKGGPRGTPVMRQYWEAKKAHPDALMLFRMGDFYETFEEDAKTASRVLGIALTKRSNKGSADKPGPASAIPWAGFPFHSLDVHLHKLIKAGLKVAICEQVEDPKLAKGIVKREVVEVITPGTALEERYLERGENNFLAGVYYTGGMAGLALLDNSTGEFFLEEIKPELLNERLARYRPAEILVAEGQADIRAFIKDRDALLTTYQDWIAEFENATRELNEHFDTNSLRGFGVEGYPQGISAAGAVLHYIYQNSPGPKAHISNLRAVQDQRYMELDEFTVRNLELFHSLATQGTHGTLVSVLDRTCSAPGARLLKRRLKAPLQDLAAITERLDRVEELVENSQLREDVQDFIKAGSDMERILGRLSAGRANPRDVAQLATSLEVTAAVEGCVRQAEAPTLNRLVDHLQDTGALVALIRRGLVEDPPLNKAKGDYIRSGHNPELDELRELARSGKKWIAGLQQKERERTGIPSLKIGFNNVFGYYLEITKTHQDKVPEDYIRKQTLVNAERYITPELKGYEEKVLTAEEQIAELERRLFDELVAEVLASAREIQANARVLAMIDVNAGLAEVARVGGYMRPEVVEGESLLLKDSRHPVVETLLPVGERFTPNDLEMDPESNQIHVITGPNMSGKSTFLRQV
ncbi:MAG: DNA mismatch repair protein MutS, partial [Candidatus Neomarinimicrobiota bacterium]